MVEKILDLTGVAHYLGVSEVTPGQWRQRTQNGELWPPFPDSDFPEITDKPLWKEKTIKDWAERSDRWPPGRAARPGRANNRRSRRTTSEEFIEADRMPETIAE
jgi:hypothetical protein